MDVEKTEDLRLEVVALTKAVNKLEQTLAEGLAVLAVGVGKAALVQAATRIRCELHQDIRGANKQAVAHALRIVDEVRAAFGDDPLLDETIKEAR
jgi:hypothetical protein